MMLQPGSLIGAGGDGYSNFFSQIIDDKIYKSKNLNPQFLRIKNNILIIILCLVAYGVYYLFQDFIDIMIIAFIAGISYQQVRDRFISILIDREGYKNAGQHTFARKMLMILPLLMVLFMLPWLRFILGDPQAIYTHFYPSDVAYSLLVSKNLLVKCVQLYLLLKITNILFGHSMKQITSFIIPRSRKKLSFLFGILFIVVSLTCVITIPAVLSREVGIMFNMAENKVEKTFGCRIIGADEMKHLEGNQSAALSFQLPGNNSLPLCSDVIIRSNSETIRKTWQEFKSQNESIRNCTTFLQGLEEKYIGGSDYIDFENVICTWYSIVQKAGTEYFGDTTQLVNTTGNIFTTIFGHLIYVLSTVSNFIFGFTTFLTIFYVTINYFNPRANVLQDIMHGQRRQLIDEITNLIQATFFIAINHFAMSITMLQLFQFSYINLFLAFLLSSMALVPFFRPWFGALIFSLVKIVLVENQVVICIMFVAAYYLLSESIYTKYFKTIQFHEVVTNMSVLFGIYQFGMVGIFYGPIIIILFKATHRELLRNQVYSVNDTEPSSWTEKKIDK